MAREHPSQETVDNGDSMLAPTRRSTRAIARLASSSSTLVGSTPIKRDAGSLDNSTESTLVDSPKVQADAKTAKSVHAAKKRRKVPTPPQSGPQPTSPRPQLVTAPPLLPPTIHFSLPAAISHLSSHDARFATMFKHIPCKPFAPPYQAIDPFRTLVTSIIGQQVSWMAARAINKRFMALFGHSGEEGQEGFPTPWQVSQEEVARLKGVGLSTRKAEYVISLAQHFVSGELSTELLNEGTDEEVGKALIAVRGIGQWTVDMFLMFSLRRPDVLPVGDLGVQKGLLRWALAAHGALPQSKAGKGQQAKEKYGLGKGKAVVDKVDERGEGEIDTLVKEEPRRDKTPEPKAHSHLPPTPQSPGGAIQVGALHTPAQKGRNATTHEVPPTPATPGQAAAETLEVSANDLPPPAPETLLFPPTGHAEWDAERAAPLTDGLTLEVMRSRLAGKKAKGGAYLTPKEMEALTDGWRPYRSLGVYYMWPAGEEW